MKVALKTIVLTLLVVTLSGCMTYRYERAETLIPPIVEEPFIETRLVQIDHPQIAEELPFVTFKALFIPLPEEPSLALLNDLVAGVSAASYEVVAFIGEEESITYLEKEFEGGSQRLAERQLVVTPHKGVLDGRGKLLLNLHPKTQLTVALLEISPGAYERLIAGADLEDLTQKDNFALPQLGGPTLLFASLGEPSSEDWFETAEGHLYRTKTSWPNSDALREAGFFDTWRLTHYSALSDPGVTWEYHYEDELVISERIDYLYVQGVVPLESHTYEIAPKGGRFAIEASFIIP
ncbi:MAG: hypothetical protein GX842_03785 [Spirochaetales bacterium]|nr:hypothetical protein [Spirochaetales bacterium]